MMLLRGIICPIVTPLLDQDTLDGDALHRLVDRLISAGIEGLFLLGTTGESASLAETLREELVIRACEAIAGRVPVLVNVSDTAASNSLALAQCAAESGADAAVIAPPSYYPLSQDELLGYLRRIVPKLELPVYLYNFPALTKIWYQPETVCVAAEELGIRGIKDSSGDMKYFAKLCDTMRGREDFSIFVGPEELLAEAMAAGAYGGVTGGANLWPELYVDWFRAIERGDGVEADRLRTVVLKMNARVYRVKKDGSSYLRGLKCAMAAKGYCRNVLAEPLEAFGGAEELKVREGLAEVGLG